MEIDFEPSYQRKGRIWAIKEKMFLIDSVLNGYDIPKLYLADFRWTSSELNPKGQTYAVVDGKQRLEALFDFIDGRIFLDQNFEFVNEPQLKLGGISYKDLKATYPRIAELFDVYTLSVMSVITDDLGRLNDLFIRLNTSKPLTGPELRNAMQGVLPKLFSKIAGTPFFLQRTKFKTNRGEDLNVAAKLLLLEFRGRIVETKKANLDRFVHEAAEAVSTDFDFAVNQVMQTLKAMGDVFEVQDPLLSSPSSIPVYYMLVRECPIGIRSFIRPALVDFERVRNEVRQKTKSGLEILKNERDAERYNLLVRSVDDASSIRDRVAILRDRIIYDYVM